MQIANTIIDLRNIAKKWQKDGESIAFVPTMGSLHAGHLKLVEEAKKSADRIVVSIFVNPTQFGVGEDFESYPRTEVDDKQKLAAAAVDLLFSPTVAEMYGDNPKTIVSVKKLSALHCGASRPGHFDGVATIVNKLFNIVQPDSAFFGQKDFQQLTIIRTMVKDLNIPVEIRSVETVRESSGLAMSSRNAYLSPEKLQVAPKLYQALCKGRDDVLSGKKTYEAIENQVITSLNDSGFQVDYFSICRQGDLVKAEKRDKDLVLLVAAKIGRTRLIDNICFSLAR